MAPTPDAGSDWETAIIAERGVSVWVDDMLDTDQRHGARVKAAGAKRATLDDLGSGAAGADLHIAALASLQGQPLAGARVLSGLQFLILNPEIGKLRRPRTGHGSWVVTLGGTDTWGVTVKVVRCLAGTDRAVTVVTGPGFRHGAKLKAVTPRHFEVKAGVPSLVAELARHDVAVTGGGITAFEACASGLACIVVANEPFEIPFGRHLQSLGCARFAGHHQELREAALLEPLAVAEMSAAGLSGVRADGLERVCDEIAKLA